MLCCSDFQRAGQCLLKNGFLRLSFVDREEVLSLPLSLRSSSFVSLRARDGTVSAPDSYTAMLELDDSAAAKLRKHRKRKHTAASNKEAAAALALRQRVALDEVFAYLHLIGGIYLASSGRLASHEERNRQLQELESTFSALEQAQKEDVRQKHAKEVAEKAIIVTILPPHQYLWALYSALKRVVEGRNNHSLLSAFADRAASLCLSPRRIHKVAEAAAADPELFGKMKEVQLAVQAAREQASTTSKKAGAADVFSMALSASKAMTPDVKQVEATLSARLAQQALERMHADTIDLLFTSLEAHKYQRILTMAKAKYLDKISKQVAQKSQKLANPRQPETLDPRRLAALLLFFRQRVAPRFHFEALKGVEEATRSQIAVMLVVDQIARAADACLFAEVHLFLSLSPLVLQLIREEAHLQDRRGEEKATGLLAKYFPESSPFRSWVTDGHGAFTARTYGGKEVMNLLEAQKSQLETTTEGGKKKRTKGTQTAEWGKHHRLQKEYIEGLLKDPTNLPFELERYFTADEFYSIFREHDKDIKEAIEASVVGAKPLPTKEIQKRLDSARVLVDTVRGCKKTGYRMIHQLQALLGEKPVVDVVLHQAETQKKPEAFKTFLWRILMEKHAKKKGKASGKLTGKLYRLSMAHLRTKKADKKAELVKAAVNACRQFKSSPAGLEDYFVGNHEFYVEVVDSYKSRGQSTTRHDKLGTFADAAELEKLLKKAHLKLTKAGKRHLKSLRKTAKSPEEWEAKALQTPGVIEAAKPAK
ncbi:hypothetical protein Efla_007037 [Eimeria flavescens]